MAVIQIIELHTKRFEEIQKLADEYHAATEGKRTVQRSFVGRDQNDPDRYFVLAFFESPEAAAQNSNLPETTAFAEKERALLDQPPTFYDLSVIEERS